MSQLLSVLLRVRVLFALLCALSGPVLADGDGLPPLSADSGRLELRGRVAVLRDPGGALTLEQAREALAEGRFTVPPAADGAADLNFGYDEAAIWLHVELHRDADAPARWLLEVAFPSLDVVELFQPDAGGRWQAQRSGDLMPFAARPLAHRNHLFALDFADAARLPVFLRVVSQGSLTLPLTVWSPAALHVEDQYRYVGDALYFGSLAALLLYNLLIWLSLREAVFLRYVAFVASLAVGFAGQNGFGMQFLWPTLPAWGNVAFPVGMAATGLFGALFTRSFLHTAATVPRLDRLLQLSVASFALSMLAPWLFGYRAAAMLTSLSGLCFAPLAVLCAVRCLWRGQAGARYFLAAWILLLLGVAVMAARNFGWLPTTWLSTHAMQIGSALEMLLLSFALADRINTMRREREAARQVALDALKASEQVLERRVAERTAELETANARLRAGELELQLLAFHDPLTALPNRALLDDRLRHALARALRARERVAVMLIDLDGFKEVNDRGGHAVGDRVLVAAALRMREQLRASDTLARLGGDEFVVVLEAPTGDAEAAAVAGKLVAALAQPITVDGVEHWIGGSVGIALFPHDGDSVDALIRAADRAMYRVKAAGKGGWLRAPLVAGDSPSP